MRLRFSDLAIGTKLTVLSTLVSGLALVAFAGAFWIYQSNAYRGAVAHEMSTLAATLADNSAAALAFHDRADAGETLALLHAEPRVSVACLYSDPNIRMSVYPPRAGAQCPARPGADRLAFTDGKLTVVRTARLRGEVAGQIWMLVNLSDLYRQIRHLGYICLIVLSASLLLAAGAAWRMQRVISGPILDLAAVASRVSAFGDYTIRAERKSTDELGTLVEKFNEMMARVYDRDIALERAQAELEERVRNRTGELQDEIVMRRLAERDLFNAKEAAEESSRAKSAFLANMSHELRTPLNAVIGYSELLEEDALEAGNASAVEDLRCIKAAGRQLLALITDVLDLSKVEAGRMEFHFERRLATDLIGEVADTIQPLAWKNGNEFAVYAPSAPFLVNVDAMRLRQSLLNLLSNACKFTENGRVTLAVYRQTLANGNWICFEVRDTGPGIAAEDLNKLFRPFSQVDASATRKHGGTGLGLSISHRFCRLMGGEITVASEPGQGSAFTIRLPEAEDASEVQAQNEDHVPQLARR